MKVSERTAELRDVLANASIDPDSKMVMENRLIQLEVDVVAMVQEARQDGYKTGYHDGFDARFTDGRN